MVIHFPSAHFSRKENVKTYLKVFFPQGYHFGAPLKKIHNMACNTIKTFRALTSNSSVLIYLTGLEELKIFLGTFGKKKNSQKSENIGEINGKKYK